MDHLLQATLNTHIMTQQRQMAKNMDSGARLWVQIWGLFKNVWSCGHYEFSLLPSSYLYNGNSDNTSL